MAKISPFSIRMRERVGEADPLHLCSRRYPTTCKRVAYLARVINENPKYRDGRNGFFQFVYATYGLNFAKNKVLVARAVIHAAHLRVLQEDSKVIKSELRRRMSSHYESERRRKAAEPKTQALYDRRTKNIMSARGIAWEPPNRDKP